MLLATLGSYLAPVLTGLVIAFLLQGMVKALERYKIPRSVGVYLSFLVFIGVVLALLFVAAELHHQPSPPSARSSRCRRYAAA